MRSWTCWKLSNLGVRESEHVRAFEPNEVSTSQDRMRLRANCQNQDEAKSDVKTLIGPVS